MKINQNHTNFDDPDRLSKDLLKKMDVHFPTSKEEAWAKLESTMTKSPDHIVERNLNRRWYLSVAAMLIILITSAAVLRYYSVTYNSGIEPLTANLPDQSMVKLDPGSSIQFYPLWWKFSRNLKLNGNAEFEVEKGKRFRVISTMGTTEVLGTTFRIESANSQYRVSCFTGSVKVSGRKSDVSAILLANEAVLINSKGKLELTKIKNNGQTEQNINENGYISFRNEAAQNVFNKLESIFGVNIELDINPGIYYTGNLKESEGITKILNAICLALELEYEQTAEQKYIIRSSATSE